MKLNTTIKRDHQRYNQLPRFNVQITLVIEWHKYMALQFQLPKPSLAPVATKPHLSDTSTLMEMSQPEINPWAIHTLRPSHRHYF